MSRANQFMMFLFVYILVYGGMNAYALLRARWAFDLGLKGTLWASGICAFMVAAPILVRVFEHRGWEGTARALAYMGYGWFGLVFLFVSAGMALECWRLAAIILSKGAAWRWYPGAGVMFYASLVVAVVVFGYGLYEAGDIRVERVSMTSKKLNHMRRKVRIAQISDVHLGLMTTRARVKKMVDILNAENPDIIVSTGDFIDGTTDDSESLAAIFMEGLAPRYGMYAVPGNHEYYAGLNKSVSFTQKAGFRVLRSEAVAMESLSLSIAGADYVSRRTTGEEPDVPEAELFSGLPEDNFNLLLKHVPYIDREAAGVMDLQLSGHTHKGQIFPFSLIVRLFYPRIAGLYFLDTGSWLYISRGTGVWGPPLRVLSPPEITIMEITPDIRD